MNNLFKLKRDGKTAGYLLLENGFLLASTNSKNYFYVQEQTPTGSLLIYPYSNDPFWIDYDSEHPFVCKDKNGNDVFADDGIKIIFPNGEEIVSKVIWDFLSWQVEGGGMLANFKQDDIELIKEQNADPI